jgi:4-hydroxybenzoate polyprenyltransferase
VTPPSVAATASALARSCHPGPSVAVTLFVTALCVTAGNGWGTCVIAAIAVLAGQLSIGWSNDRLDVQRDRAVRRLDKPLATEEAPLRTTDIAISVALLATVAFSFALGARAGGLHLAAVACGWSYNLGLKRTWWSWLPYALAFGSLPVIATLALPDPRVAGAWAIGAGALFGVTAHLTNALPDLVDDRETGVVGFPHRIGARACLAASAGLALAASLLVVFGPPGSPSTLGWVGVVVSLGLVGAGLPLAWRRPFDRRPFLGIIGVVGFDIVLIIATGHHLR